MGAVTFSNRKGNAVASMKSSPLDRKTESQVEHQAALALAAKAWANLSYGAQFNWKLFAAKNVRQNRLGVTRQLSPYQFYLKENVLRAQIGATLRTNPPTKGQQGVGSFSSLLFSYGGPYALDLYSPLNDPDGWFVIYGSHGGKTNAIGKRYPRLVHAEHVTDSLSVDLYTPWTDILGPMFSGELYWLAWRYLGDSSLASIPASLTQSVF
jgi:hypothetical protein